MNRLKFSSVIVAGSMLAVAGVLLSSSLSEPRAQPDAGQPGDVAIEQARNAAQAVGAADSLAFMDAYCVSYHGPGKQQDKVRFDSLAEMAQVDRDEREFST